MKYCLYICFFIAIAQKSLFAQKEFELPKTHEVIVNSGDSIIKAHVLYDQDKKIRTKNDRTYYWYSRNSIKSNEGDYHGKLLYGSYKLFDKNNNLLQKGTLEKGVKKGKWIEWYQSGKIKSISHWKNGAQNGPYSHFDEEGKLIEEGFIKRGEKVGKTKEFNGKSGYNKVKYVDLNEIPKQKNDKKKIQLFKKKEKAKTNEQGMIRSKEKSKKEKIKKIQKQNELGKEKKERKKRFQFLKKKQKDNE